MKDAPEAEGIVKETSAVVLNLWVTTPLGAHIKYLHYNS